jgi:hypothetical protein
MTRLCRTLAATLALAALSSAHAQSTPKTGTEVLQRMHDAYAGKWYHTLAFVQQTTAYRGATPTVTTWYEALRHTDNHGTQLRIDVGEPAAGNGMLYTADSMWRMRDGKLAAQSDQGNEFLPMIEGVYVQPIVKTLEQIKGFGVDMSKVSSGKWQDRPVWIVGAASAADSTSPQFWIDIDRKVVVRMLMSSGATGSALMDIHLDGYVPLGGGWLATKIAMLVGGKPRQTEVYSQWKANIDLAPGLFDPATWSTTPHWAAKP